MDNMITVRNDEFIKELTRVINSKGQRIKGSSLLNMALCHCRTKLEEENQAERDRMECEDLAKRRNEVANETFETTDLPPVEDHDGWEINGNHWHKTVYWKPDHEHTCKCEDCNSSLRGGFDIEFKEGTAEIFSTNYNP